VQCQPVLENRGYQAMKGIDLHLIVIASTRHLHPSVSGLGIIQDGAMLSPARRTSVRLTE
jgi:hypothetical protein